MGVDMSRLGKGSGRYRIQAIDRVMKVLTAFDVENSEMSLGEIAKKTGIPKSTVHRIIASLSEWNVIRQNSVSGKYGLGLRLFELGSIVLSQMSLRKEALPFLKKLSDDVGMTVHLVVRDGSHAIYIEKIEPPGSMVSYSRVGKQLPLHCTAVGKVLLADLSRDEIEKLLEHGLPAKTPNTIITIDELFDCLERVRSGGYAVDNEELEIGLKCLGSPIFNYRGEVVGAISLSTSPTRMNDEVMGNLINSVKGFAGKISSRLGFAGKAKNFNWDG